MIRLALIAWLALCGVANAQLSGGLQFPGPGTAHSAGASYTGPGDVAGATAATWCGLHAYSNAAIGQNAIRVTRRGDSATSDFATIAGGGLDGAAITSFITGGGDTRGEVTICYDQTGNGKNWTAAAGTAPQIIVSGQGGKPVMRSPNSFGTPAQLQQTTLSISQPYSIIYSAVRATSSGVEEYAYGDVNVSVVLGGWRTTANTAFMSSQTNQNATASDGTFHAFAAIYNGASSSLVVGSSSTSTSPGTNPIGNSFGIMGAVGQGGMTGDLESLGIWASDRSATAVAINGTSCTWSSYSC